MDSCNHKDSKVKFNNNKELISGIFKYINDKGQAIINCDNKYIEYNGPITIL